MGYRDLGTIQAKDIFALDAGEKLVQAWGWQATGEAPNHGQRPPVNMPLCQLCLKQAHVYNFMES